MFLVQVFLAQLVSSTYLVITPNSVKYDTGFVEKYCSHELQFFDCCKTVILRITDNQSYTLSRDYNDDSYMIKYLNIDYKITTVTNEQLISVYISESISQNSFAYGTLDLTSNASALYQYSQLLFLIIKYESFYSIVRMMSNTFPDLIITIAVSNILLTNVNQCSTYQVHWHTGIWSIIATVIIGVVLLIAYYAYKRRYGKERIRVPSRSSPDPKSKWGFEKVTPKQKTSKLSPTSAGVVRSMSDTDLKYKNIQLANMNKVNTANTGTFSLSNSISYKVSEEAFKSMTSVVEAGSEPHTPEISKVSEFDVKMIPSEQIPEGKLITPDDLKQEWSISHQTQIHSNISITKLLGSSGNSSGNSSAKTSEIQARSTYSPEHKATALQNYSPDNTEKNTKPTLPEIINDIMIHKETTET